jgi:2-polyprenyl-3-methyl-5-hydroxy-6-metoxy-1,4-benzoquinol methylase
LRRGESPRPSLRERKKQGRKLDVKEERALGHVLNEHWYYRSKGLALDVMLRGQSFRSLLDIGAGSGIFSKRLLKRGAASAICIDPAYQEERRELLNGKPIWFLRQIGSEKCDLILLMDVLEHVDDDVGLIRAALVGAAQDTLVLITVPAFQTLFSAHDLFLEHKRRYTLRQITEVVRAAGLEIVSARYFFAFLLPIAAALRLLKRQSEPKSDLKEHSRLVNSLLCCLHRLELSLFRFNRMGGLTVFCLARVL